MKEFTVCSFPLFIKNNVFTVMSIMLSEHGLLLFFQMNCMNFVSNCPSTNFGILKLNVNFLAFVNFWSFVCKLNEIELLTYEKDWRYFCTFNCLNTLWMVCFYWLSLWLCRLGSSWFFFQIHFVINY